MQLVKYGNIPRYKLKQRMVKNFEEVQVLETQSKLILIDVGALLGTCQIDHGLGVINNWKSQENIDQWVEDVKGIFEPL